MPEQKQLEAKEDLGKEVGKVTHYFGNISVAVVELSASLAVGDQIHIKGNTTDFEQSVSSMQIEHEARQKAGKGDAIGLKVKEKVRQGDLVYKK